MIRAMEERDVAGVVAMVGALAAHHGDEATLCDAALRRDALGAAPWLWVLVAEEEGVLVGYAALVATAQLQFAARGMDLHHLFVEPSMRGRGIGKALINAALETARGMKVWYVTVGTDPRNEAAGDIYRAVGFTPSPMPGPRFRIRV